MYFYSLSNGCYAEYDETILYHESKFTQEEFFEMFNDSIGVLSDDTNHTDTAEVLCNKYNFSKLEIQIGIYADYGNYRKLTKEDVREHTILIDAEDKSYLSK